MEGTKLYKLLDLDPFKKGHVKLQSETIIKEVRKNPQPVKTKHNFRHDIFTFTDYPLHQAIRLRANIQVVEAIYNSYPPAIKDIKDATGDTALTLSLTFNAPVEVILFLFNKWPEASRHRNSSGCVALHHACKNIPSLEVVSALLNYWPDAITERTKSYSTPLHHACCGNAPYNVMLFLMEKWPEATIEGDSCGNIPLFYSENQNTPEDVQELLSRVTRFCAGTMDNVDAKDIMNEFIEIGWWSDALSIIDHHPSVSQHLDIDINVLPYFLSTVGRCCKMKTLWYVIINKQDIFEGI